MIRHIIPISGKDSLCAALVQIKNEPLFDYEFIYNATGEELPEVFLWLKKVEKYLNKEIKIVGENLSEIIEYDMNWFLPSRNHRYCTRLTKIKPMEKYIGKDHAFVYFGLRYDENRIGYKNNSNKNIVPKYPLIENEICIEDVYKIISRKKLKPPSFFWQRLYDEVSAKCGGNLIKSIFKEWQIDYIFAWRSRANCAMCFNQRQYEWVGLLEHYPDMFWNYESWEHNVSEYYLAGKDVSLKYISENKEAIFQKRVKRLVKFIQSKRQLKIEFVLNDDFFVNTNCGLMCGK
jgi:hypothetical protein